VKYAWIDSHRTHFPIELMCGALGVSRSGFFGWRARRDQPGPDADTLVRQDMREAHQHSRRLYGRRRLTHALRERGHCINLFAVAFRRTLVMLQAPPRKCGLLAQRSRIHTLFQIIRATTAGSRPAEEAAGNRSNADAILKASGTFVDCYRFRADILDGRDDWAGSQKAYAEAVALAPDLPAAYYSWGVALARHGDLAGAAVKLELANQRGPHWADPLKAWGDVLVRQRNTKEALVKYDEALKYAPNWKQLKDARDALAKQKV